MSTHVVGIPEPLSQIPDPRRAKDGMWDRRKEISFYVCSAAIPAEQAAVAIRSHWGVENRNHHVRDTL